MYPNQECGNVTHNLGEFESPQLCAVAAEAHVNCSTTFMYSSSKYFSCFCCSDPTNGNSSVYYSVYGVDTNHDQSKFEFEHSWFSLLSSKDFGDSEQKVHKKIAESW